MKHILILIFALFNHIICAAQTVDQLDAKNGFKDFKIGDSKNKWSNQIEFEEFINNKDIALYRYKGNCCSSMYNQPLASIELGFSTKTEKLVYILLSTGKLNSSHGSTNEFLSLCFADFKQTFGPPSDMDDPISRNADFPAFVYIWKGNRILLKLTEFFSRDYKMSVAEVFDKEYIKQKNATGF